MLLLYWFLVLLMVVGIIGAVVPGIPGIGLVVVAIAAWGVLNGFDGLGIPMTVAIVALLLGTAVDFLATYWGAKKAGASRWGLIGAVVGLVLGIIGLLPALPVGGPLLGMIVGPLVGAILGEFLYRRNLWMATKAGIGIIVGSAVGMGVQLLLAIATVGIFLYATLPTILGT